MPTRYARVACLLGRLEISLMCHLFPFAGAGGGSHQPPARNGRADPYWRADNCTAVIT